MPAERVSMRKTHEVLRLHFDLKLKQRQIARSANLSQSTVHEYLHRFTAAGLDLATSGADVGAGVRGFIPHRSEASARPGPQPPDLFSSATRLCGPSGSSRKARIMQKWRPPDLGSDLTF